MKKKHSIILIALILIIVFIPGDLKHLNSKNLSGFMIQNWSINYDSGFVFRGFIGTILTSIVKPITPNLIMAILYVLIGTYIVIIYLYSNALYQKHKKDITLLFLIFLLAQPSVLQKLITTSTIGRLDIILALLFLLILLVYKIKNNYIKYSIVAILSILGLLIHEGFMVFFVPTIFLFLLLFDDKKWRPVCCYFAPLVVAWLLIVFNGKADILIEELLSLLTTNAIPNYGRDFNEYNLKLVYYMDIREKIAFTINFYDKTKIFKLLLTFIVLSPSLYCLIRYYISLFKNVIEKKQKLILVILYFATLSPLAALLFGIDTYRWVGMALFNNCAVLAILFYYNDKYREVIIETTNKIKHSLIIAIVVSLVSGVFSVFYSYPFIEKYIQLFLG
jgi:hypothetical protein